MSRLLREIRSIDRDAARVLEQAEFLTDSDIQSLSRGDLQELLPGPQKLKLRRTIFETIHKQRPVDLLLRDLSAFIPHDSLKAALTNNGILVDYLHVLKDMKTQMDCVQSFLDAHIGFLEGFNRNQPDQERDKGSLESPINLHVFGLWEEVGVPGGNPRTDWKNLQTPHERPLSHPGTGASYSSGSLMPYSGVSTSETCRGVYQGGPLTTQPSQEFKEVTYHPVVSGKTFEADRQLMGKVRTQDQLRLYESSEGYHVTIVFCPITSRVGSDVDAALTDVEGDKPIILVLMHHTHEVRHTGVMRTWRRDGLKIVLAVEVFYHETKHGLLKCLENDEAASKIGNKLLEYGIPIPYISGNAGSGGVGSAAGRGGGNEKGSDNKSSSTFSLSNWFQSGKTT